MSVTIDGFVPTSLSGGTRSVTFILETLTTSGDLNKILDFIASIQKVYNITNNTVGSSYRAFYADWATAGANSVIGRSQMLDFIRKVNDSSNTFTQLAIVLRFYDDFNRKHGYMTQRGKATCCYGRPGFSNGVKDGNHITIASFVQNFHHFQGGINFA